MDRTPTQTPVLLGGSLPVRKAKGLLEALMFQLQQVIPLNEDSPGLSLSARLVCTGQPWGWGWEGIGRKDASSFLV